MTTETNKIRAVFLAALMVLSVFAGTVAFSGSVAAAESADGGSVSNETVYEQTTNTHTVQLNATLNTTATNNPSNANYTVTFPDSPDFDLSAEDNSTVQIHGTGSGNVDVSNTYWDSANNNFTVELARTGADGSPHEQDVNLSFRLRSVVAPEVSSTTSGQASFALDTNADNTDEYSTNIQQLTVEATPEGAPELESAVHYDDTIDGGVGVELAFSEAVDVAADDITLYEGDSEVDAYTVEDTGVTGRVFVTTDGELLTGDLKVGLSSDIADVDGDTLVDTGNNSVTFAPVTVAETDDKSAYKGGNVAIIGDQTNDDVEIEGPGSYYFEGSTDTNSEVLVFNTTNRDFGQYNVSIDGSNIDSTQVTVRDLGFGVTIDDVNVTTDDTIEVDLSANAGNRDVEVDLLDSNGDSVNSTQVTTDGQGEAIVEFNTATADGGDALDTGDYTVEATDLFSGVSTASPTITVSQAADTDVNFAENVIVNQRGDFLEATIEMTQTSEATLSFGSESDGVVANATVDDADGDDQVTVLLNTYNFKTGGNIYSLPDDSDDELLDQNLHTPALDDLIDAGDYDFEVQAGDQGVGTGVTSSDDVATVTLEERSTDALRMWTGSSDEIGSVSDLEDVNEALDEGQITQSSEVAVGDLAVHQLEASGFEGALDARENEDVTSQFLTLNQSGPINLTIEEASPGANQQSQELALNSTNNLTVIADGVNDTYYIVVDTGEAQFKGGEDLPTDEDTALETNFTVINDDAGFDFTSSDLDSDENEETILEWDANEPDVTVSQPYNVSQASGQSIGGTTNIAPGTELNLRVRSQSGTSPSFLKTASPVVESDGTWSAEFDFSEQNVGDEYDIVVNANILASATEEEGTVVEAVETPTATPEPETDTSQTETDTSSPGTDTPEPDTATPEPAAGTSEPTETSTPGFGVVVALTALLAAALLATRRER
ncbi:DUF7827 domain-containing protein [Halobellus limi]|uniref:PGF-CTERM protein/surface glycoprotein n=1 Tax=Halobellus limi TaxID=699433 RepID=A0A1H5UUH8_9EURY|nr:BGTF surface domain-containing protein [Halobellus limi]QCC46916.1 PGF-CTERM sorting domain-containing protein [Halobellus limi]SEF78656.1 PGF-CTERM protein/surface glycoprotein [Halobellus limi]